MSSKRVPPHHCYPAVRAYLNHIDSTSVSAATGYLGLLPKVRYTGSDDALRYEREACLAHLTIVFRITLSDARYFLDQWIRGRIKEGTWKGE